MTDDLVWWKKFDYEVLDLAYTEIGGEGTGFEEISSMAGNNTKASSFKGTPILRFMDSTWVPVYLSKDKNNNVIMTLWNFYSFYGKGLNMVNYSLYARYGSCDGEIFKPVGGYRLFRITDSLFRFDQYDGAPFCPMGYSKSSDKHGVISADNYSNPGNLYKFCTRSGTSNFISFTQIILDEDTREPDLTVRDEFDDTPITLGNYGAGASDDITKYLVTPRDVPWQENQSAKEILGLPYNLSNEAWSLSVSDDGFYSSKNNYAHISGSDSWADEYLWLPSLSEIGDNGENGLWGVGTRLRMNSLREHFQAAGSSVAEAGTWTRSANYKQTHGYYFIKSSGDGKGVGTVERRKYRPCVHLNLTAIEADR